MRLLFSAVPLAAALAIAACSPPAPDAPPAQGSASTAAGDNSTPAPGKTAPASAALGTPAWYAWVDTTLAISDDGHGPKPETPAWNQAVNTKLGEEAPQAPVGSAEWQQAVDALLRTRVATH